jgi:hypothetical protein
MGDFMQRWIGRWIIGTATVHTLFALVVFSDTWGKVISNGVVNSVGENADIAASVFFLLWGLLYYVLGFVADNLEKEHISLPLSLGWGLLLNGAIAVIFVPASGFWLLFPPAVTIIFHGYKTRKRE